MKNERLNRISRLMCVILSFALVSCEIGRDPYFATSLSKCIGLHYDKQVALVVSYYSEGGTYGPPIVEKYLKKAGFDVLLSSAFGTITVDKLIEQSVSIVWVFSGCSGGSISQQEEDALYQYSQLGGSLAILADNLPCVVGVTGLAAKFGVSFTASPTGDVPMLTKSGGTLKAHCITEGIDALPGGVTPSTIQFPKDNREYRVIGATAVDTLFVILENTKTRVFFDSAWTRYRDTDWQTGKPTGDLIARFVANIAGYLNCKCNGLSGG